MGKFLFGFKSRSKAGHTKVNRKGIWAGEIPVSISQKADG
jgi:hypothetical protein